MAPYFNFGENYSLPTPPASPSNTPKPVTELSSVVESVKSRDADLVVNMKSLDSGLITEETITSENLEQIKQVVKTNSEILSGLLHDAKTQNIPANVMAYLDTIATYEENFSNLQLANRLALLKTILTSQDLGSTKRAIFPISYGDKNRGNKHTFGVVDFEKGISGVIEINPNVEVSNAQELFIDLLKSKNPDDISREGNYYGGHLKYTPEPAKLAYLMNTSGPIVKGGEYMQSASILAKTYYPSSSRLLQEASVQSQKAKIAEALGI